MIIIWINIHSFANIVIHDIRAVSVMPCPIAADGVTLSPNN